MAEIRSDMSGSIRPSRHLFIIAIVLCASIFSSLAPLLAEASSRAEKNQDIVFLVDISSSMSDMFGDVKAAILEYIGQTKPGDNVILISFGERVTLRFRQTITSKADIKRIERELKDLEPTEYSTYITGALDRGLEELRLLERKNPEHLRTMVLLSDGKNNPPASIAASLTFDEISNRYPQLLQRPGTAFFYLSLGENPDQQVLSFMEGTEGSSFDLGMGVSEATDAAAKRTQLAMAQIFVEPVSIDLGTVLGPKATATVSLAFLPARGNPSGRVITTDVSARFRGNPSWKTIIEVEPIAITCSSSPWSEDLKIKIDSLHEGTVVGTLEFTTPPGQVLFINPREIPITMTIGQPHMRVMQEKKLRFGPVYPDSKFQETQTITLVPNEAAARGIVRARPDVVVPEGMAISTRIEKHDDVQDLMVTVSTDESFKSTHSMTIEGGIRLFGEGQQVSFSRDEIEIQIEVAPTAPKGGAVRDTIAELLSGYGRYVAYALIAVLLLLIVGMGGYWWLRLRPQSSLEGMLVLIHMKRRAPGKNKMVKVNLHSIGKSIRRDTVILGSSKDAGITLPHKSVAAYHCEIAAQLAKGTKRILIEPVGTNSVIVNLHKIKEPTPLSDRDLIEIGAYTFRFENAHPYKQIVVRYLDGRILKGTPATWDIESDGFSLLPRDSLPGSDEEIFVSFADLKAVYFVRDFDGQIGKKIVSPASQIRGIHMKLTFHDGEVVDGYTSEGYTPTSERFYFFPADQSGNTISMVVERDNLKNLEIFRRPGRGDAADTIAIDT